MDFHFAIDVVTDLAAILLECSVSGSVNLQDLDEYNTPARRIRITVTPEEHDAMNKALADFAQNPLEYDLSEMMDNEEIQEMARVTGGLYSWLAVLMKRICTTQVAILISCR